MKSLICKVGKKIYDLGFAPGCTGNISCMADDKIFITPAGSCLGALSEQDIIITDIDGNILEGSKKPSSERFMHYEIYKKRADVKCIIHAHPPKATVISVSGGDLNTPLIAEGVVALGEIPLIRYETPSTHDLAELVAEGFINHEAALMANHGATVVGSELMDTFYKLETLEFLAEISILTDLLGSKNPIPAVKVQDLIKIREQKHGTV